MEYQLKERLHQLEIDSILKEGIYADLCNHRMEVHEGDDCPLCIKREKGDIGQLRKMSGRFGPFLSCNRYPYCKFTWNTPDLVDSNSSDLEKVIV